MKKPIGPALRRIAIDLLSLTSRPPSGGAGGNYSDWPPRQPLFSKNFHFFPEIGILGVETGAFDPISGGFRGDFGSFATLRFSHKNLQLNRLRYINNRDRLRCAENRSHWAGNGGFLRFRGVIWGRNTTEIRCREVGTRSVRPQSPDIQPFGLHFPPPRAKGAKGGGMIPAFSGSCAASSETGGSQGGAIFNRP